MTGLLSFFEDTVEFTNPEYLMVLPVAALIFLFGLSVFAVRLALRPARTHGSSYPLVGHIKFWFMLVVTLSSMGLPGLNGFVGEFTISRTGPTNSGLPVFVHCAGTATPGKDYDPLPWLVTIPAG